MSRKHAHRAGNQPVTRRYVAGVVRRARDEIISAIVHSRSAEPEPMFLGWWPTVRTDGLVGPTPERLERAVNGKES